jgi:hypothetical protein
MPTNQTPINVVTMTVAFLAAICVWTICWLSYKSIQIPPELNTLTGTLCGYLTGALTKTTPTETIRQQLPTSDNPIPVKPITSIADPVHTEEAQPIKENQT